MSDLTWRVERHRGPCKQCAGTGFCFAGPHLRLRSRQCPDCHGVSGGTVLIGTQVSAHHADGSTAWVSGLLQNGADLRKVCAQSGLLSSVELAIELGAQIRAAMGE